MIIPIARVRILGPRPELDAVLSALQDVGMVHLSEPRLSGPLRPVENTPHQQREQRNLKRMLGDIEAVTARMENGTSPRPGADGGTVADYARWARTGRRLRRELDRLDREEHRLEEERAQIVRFEQFVSAFRGLLPSGTAARMQSYHLVLRGEDAQAVPRLRDALAEVIGDDFLLESTSLPTGELAAILLVRQADAPRVERLLAQAGVHELPLPPAFQDRPLTDAMPELANRREKIDRALVELRAGRAAAMRDRAPSLRRARARVQDRLLELDAREQAVETPRSFVLEGWIPEAGLARLTTVLSGRFGSTLVVEPVAREEWRASDAPVVLSNPPVFRPFEAVTRMVPLPRYGSIDPTPFVAVFFPVFFGMILGDIGYGLVLGLLARVLRRRSTAGTTRRSVAEVLGACAVFSIAFGVAFGEFFGDLGRQWFGLRPLVLDREESLLAFLGLAVAIGLVHIVLGQILGIVNAARGHPREAVGRSAALAMVLLVVLAILAAVEVVPHGFFTPAVIAILVAFPILVIAEGVIAPIELLSTFANILSYARIMALGTASVMMAVVANRLAGSMGGVIVGVLFGLLFHLVNFVLGVFAPTIHGLRLHYVEFFGKFYSPGGQEFRPFAHWRPGGPRTA